ncbi:unnamed protein product [Dovyalis caffra]|uniref:GATA-type domain-containing protein n=1 Tax=Dovyalis caffra TaxID=77055 RepID=A0AAV1RS58_9ROSI|nr:unnamed protein product [Dovyalis caffra]
MDSQSFHQSAAGSNGSYNYKNDAENMVDLTLRLGSGNNGGINHQINLSDLFNIPVFMTTGSNTKDNKELNFGPADGTEEHVGEDHFGIINNSYYAPNANGSNIDGRSGNVAEINFGLMIPGGHSQGGQAYNYDLENQHRPSLLPTSTLKNYTLLSDSSRDAQIENSYGSRRRQPRRRTRQICYRELNKRCRNKQCNTMDTPMWRRGPLGHKTLCNACGIRYRKEQDRKKAREAAASDRNGI